MEARRGSLRRVVAASVVGTSLEWYDFFLYGTAAALVFGELFFPDADPLVGTLLAFATYAVGFVARPLGGIVFGHFGDRTGPPDRARRATLLRHGRRHVRDRPAARPTTAIGIAAPILLVTLRFVQGLGLGGEWGGAVLMVSEHGDQRRRGLYASWPQVGVPAGNLLAAGVLALLAAVLSDEAFTALGLADPVPAQRACWSSSGSWIRLRIEESPLFQQVEQTATRAARRWSRCCATHPRAARDRLRRADRHGRGLLRLHALHPHLRHRAARPRRRARR